MQSDKIREIFDSLERFAAIFLHQKFKSSTLAWIQSDREIKRFLILILIKTSRNNNLHNLCNFKVIENIHHVDGQSIALFVSLRAVV
jgi:hypothetical protein